MHKYIFCILRIVGNAHLNVHFPTHSTAVHKTRFVVKNRALAYLTKREEALPVHTSERKGDKLPVAEANEIHGSQSRFSPCLGTEKDKEV